MSRHSRLSSWIARRFSRATIRSKIIVLIMVTVVAALSLTAIAVITDDAIRERRRVALNLTAIAQVISANSTAAVAFRDPKALNEILGSLKYRKNIVLACVYDVLKNPLASFSGAKGHSDCPPAGPSKSYEFREGHLWVYEPIVLEQKTIGTLMLVSDLDEMRESVLAHALILTMLFVLAAVSAFFLSGRLERFVAGPVRELASTARLISEKRDYSIRAVKRSEDEMATLIDAFNLMLSQVEQQNRELERLLRETQTAVKVRDEFLSIASHELRTPLTSLRAEIQVIQMLVEKDLLATYPKERLQQLVRLNERQFTRLSRLVDDLLDVSRISSGHLTLDLAPVPIGSIVRDALSVLRGDLSVSKSEVTVNVSAEATGLWDRLRLEQVFVNLISNALKYGAGKPIRIDVAKVDDSVEVSVHDQGIGIAEADLKRLFQRFERAASSRHFGGLGLGLYITRQIVEAHGGTIRISSSPGEGTKVTVRLPLRATAANRKSA